MTTFAIAPFTLGQPVVRKSDQMTGVVVGLTQFSSELWDVSIRHDDDGSTWSHSAESWEAVPAPSIHNRLDHADHVTEEWFGHLSGDPEANPNDTGITCHTCQVVVIDEERPFGGLAVCSMCWRNVPSTTTTVDHGQVCDECLDNSFVWEDRFGGYIYY